jgi:uncharacterized membrane protein YoaK (UPF0700 family)
MTTTGRGGWSAPGTGFEASAVRARQSRTTAGTLRLSAVLGVAGGFLDAFTYIAHGGVFANPQTGNVVFLGVSAARGDWADVGRHTLPILAFIVGVATAETVAHPRIAGRVRRPLRAALIIELLTLGAIGALPALGNTIIVLAVAFVAALQNSTFSTLGDWPVNTTMTTGNLRTAIRAAYRLVVRRQSDAAEQARAFGAVCLAFLVGAVVGALATLGLGNPAVWGADLLVGVALLLFVLDEHGSGGGGAAGPAGASHRPGRVGTAAGPDDEHRTAAKAHPGGSPIRCGPG